MTITANAPDLWWAAGFLEGEGTFRKQTHRTGGVSLLISACQVQQEPLERLCCYLGGKISGPYTTPSNPRRSPFYVWAVNGRYACDVMRILHPFMSPKRQTEIDGAIAAWKSRPTKGESMRVAWVKWRLRNPRHQKLNASDSRQLQIVG